MTFEFEEQLVGFPYFTIDAPAGTIVELLVQEGHAVGGAALLDTGRDSWSRFTCRDGVNQFECFDYESLRWLQLHVRNCGTGQVTVRDVGVRRRTFPWAHQPVAGTGEPALRRLFEAAHNTLVNSAQDVVVDGMGRERQQYSGDCGHQLRSIRAAFGEARLPARFLATYSQGITVDGYFLDCWPAYDRLAHIAQRELGLFHLGPIVDHGVQLVFDCWNHYLDTADLAALREPYPRLLRFADYLRSLPTDGGLLPVENLGVPCVWMDYAAYRQSGGMPHVSQRRKQCAFNLYVSAMLAGALAPICRAFGDDAKAGEFDAWSRAIRAATVTRYWSAEHRTFVNNLPWLGEEKRVSMCDRSLATAVLFDQCPDGDTRAAVEALATCPPELGLSYPANAGWRLLALGKARRADVIVNELRTRWATMESVRLNNTLQEGWKIQPDTGHQWSHCAVAPLYVTHECLAGIRPLSPGYGQAEVDPQLADLTDLEVVTHTPRGPIRFQATGKVGDRTLAIEIPGGCTAELVLDQRERVGLERARDAARTGTARYRLPAGERTLVRVSFT